MTDDPPLHYLGRSGGERLAYRHRTGTPESPTIIWLGGFMSDMEGTKATALDQSAARAGYSFLRFDYFAHGRSSGDLARARIGRWREDTLAVIDTLSQGPLVLVGSSMGGWMALLAARARPARVAGLLLIAPAPDFTEQLMWPRLPAAAQAEITKGGTYGLPSDYGTPPFPLTRAFFEDGRQHTVLDAPIPFDGPVRIVQGMADPDVPWRHAVAVAERLQSPDLTLTLIKDGDHRLSGPRDLARLERAMAELASGLANGHQTPYRPARRKDEDDA